MLSLTPDQLMSFSMANSIGGMFSSAIGGYYGAKMQKQNLKFQADMAGINSRIAELGAQSELAQGNQQVAAFTLRAGQMKSTQRAAMAANGIDLGEGNAAEIQASTEIMKNIDMGTLASNAIRSAWGYRMQGVNANIQGLMANATASGINPASSAFSSLLTGAGKVADTWYSWNKNTASAGTASAEPVVSI